MKVLLKFKDSRAFNCAGGILIDRGIGFTITAKEYEVELADGMTQNRAQKLMNLEIAKRSKRWKKG